MPDPTDADHVAAVELLAAIEADAVWITATRQRPVDRIAAALAGQRAAAEAALRRVREVIDRTNWTDADPLDIRARLRQAVDGWEAR